MWRFTAKQKVESSPYQPVRRNKWRWIRRKNKWIQLSKLFGNRTKWRNNCFRKTHTYTYIHTYIHYFCTFSIETMPTKLLHNITSNLISFFSGWNLPNRKYYCFHRIVNNIQTSSVFCYVICTYTPLNFEVLTQNSLKVVVVYLHNMSPKCYLKLISYLNHLVLGNN